jgi:hypothetical protein
MQVAGREEALTMAISRLAHRGPRCAHTEERPLPRPAATASPSIRQIAKRHRPNHRQVRAIGIGINAYVYLYPW